MRKLPKLASKRIDIVDFWRFCAAIMIMCCHLPMLIGRHHDGGGYFVEFFFMLTGYFIFRHFQKPAFYRASLNAKAKHALKYTWQRFVSLLPFTIPIVVICSLVFYIISFAQGQTGIVGLLSPLRNIIPEFLLLPKGVMTDSGRMIGPIWYLSIMIVSMPVISLIAQSKHKYINIGIILFATFFYLTCIHSIIVGDVHSVNTFFRGFLAMLIGGLIFYASNYFAKLAFRKWFCIFLTITELALYAYAILASWFNVMPYTVLPVVFFFAIIITLSGHSYTSKIHGKLFTFLGGITLPLFMWHYGILRIILLFPELRMLYRLALFFGISFITSILHYLIVKKCQGLTPKLKRLFLK